MKVVLLKDVAKIGRKNTVVDVPDGYGQNHLIPRGWAKPATASNLKEIEHQEADKTAKLNTLEENYFKAKTGLTEKPVVLTAPKNDNGHLFAAIHHDQIVAAIRERGFEIESDMVKVPTPIKEVGEHEATLTFGSHLNNFIIKVE